MIAALAMAASVVIVVTYLVSPGRWFHWSNAVLWPIVAASGVVVGAWPQTFLTVTFGAGGMIALARRRRQA